MATPKSRATDWRHARVGAVLIVGILLLIYGIFQIGKVMDVFADRYTLHALVESASGLQEGSPVHLAGQRVGQVKEITFLPPERKRDGANLVVTLEIDERVQPQIRRDSRGFLLSLGLLGDRYVNIAPGTTATAALQPGDTLRAVGAAGIDELMSRGAVALDTVMMLVTDLRTVTGSIARGEGTLGQLVADRRLYDRLASATDELHGLLTRVNRADGTLNRLIHDRELYARLNAAVAGVDDLTRGIAAGRGSLGKLIASDSLHDRMLATVRGADVAAANLARLSQALTEGDGTVRRLFTDPALYDQLLKLVVDLQSLVEAVREDPKPFLPPVQIKVF